MDVWCATEQWTSKKQSISWSLKVLFLLAVICHQTTGSDTDTKGRKYLTKDQKIHPHTCWRRIAKKLDSTFIGSVVSHGQLSEGDTAIALIQIARKSQTIAVVSFVFQVTTKNLVSKIFLD